MRTTAPTGIERHLTDDELIVSKTDRRGVITYANSVFLRIAALTEAETLGAAHALIRHPDTPRCLFRLLWRRIESGGEMFAYINNLAADGANYWVLAHVTPSRDASGAIVGFHSNRRKPDRGAVTGAAALYRELKAIEDAAPGKEDGIGRALAHLESTLAAKGMDYDAFVFSL
jgi:PAS domain S-box-containing protein